MFATASETALKVSDLRHRERLHATVDKLDKGTTIGVIELSTVLAGTKALSASAFERFFDADVLRSRRARAAAELEARLGELLAKLKVDDIKRLHSTYAATVMQAATSWVFDDCNTFWSAENTAQTDTDCKLMDVLIKAVPTNERVAETLSRSLTWSPPDRERVDAVLNEVAAVRPQLQELPVVLSCMMLFDVLVQKPHSTEADIQRVYNHVALQYKVKKEDLPRKLREQMLKGHAVPQQQPEEEAQQKQKACSEDGAAGKKKLKLKGRRANRAAPPAGPESS